ncbi:MAG: DUF2855 family protein, partial [Pseudomonadota bacterium]
AEWGVIPVWGFAKVVESRHSGVEVGERLYGYWPTGTHLVLEPGKLRDNQLSDLSPHRAELAAVYNSYSRVDAEAHYDPGMDDERMLLMPLYATSFCLYDFLKDNAFFDASQVIIPSASSKTAIGLAYALHDDGDAPASVGVTSASSVERVSSLGLYDEVFAYDHLGSIDSERSSVIVDMSGNGSVLSDLHLKLGDQTRYTANVGLTHYDAREMGPGFIAERSAMFFAPGHIQKRAEDWGPGEFQKRAFLFWHSAATRSREWLRIEHCRGVDGIQRVFKRVRDGDVGPDTGLIVDLS